MARRSAGRRSRATGSRINQMDWRQIEIRTPPIKVLSDDQIEAICDTAYRILEEVGMDILHEGARTLLGRAGADVEAGSQRVRFDRGLIREAMRHAPSTVTLEARNPQRSLHLGDSRVAFSSVASAPNASDIVGGRRSGNHRDYQDFLKLGQSLNIVHCFGGYPVEPTDLPPATRHLDCIRDFVLMTDKVYHAYSLGRERIADALEITRLAHGCGEAELSDKTRLFTIINTSSPLRLDGVMIDGAFEMARHNQLCVITPFTLSGAMSPVTIAGALAQQHAEALAGMALLQIHSPGLPGGLWRLYLQCRHEIWGTGLRNAGKRARFALIGGQLARKVGVPYRSSNANASNCVDAQATYESQMSIWAALMGHANLLMHAAGWIEGGLCASFEKMIIDAEMLQVMSELLPADRGRTKRHSGFEAVMDVGPGGHFFGTAHTLERYETAFLQSPLVSDWSNFENWHDNGATGCNAREPMTSAAGCSTEYQAPDRSISPAPRRSMPFVERRKRGGWRPGTVTERNASPDGVGGADRSVLVSGCSSSSVFAGIAGHAVAKPLQVLPSNRLCQCDFQHRFDQNGSLGHISSNSAVINGIRARSSITLNVDF